MSLNYPNRDEWLAVRCTPRKAPPGRFVHVSTRYRWLPVNAKYPQGPVRFVAVAPGVTYRRTA